MNEKLKMLKVLRSLNKHIYLCIILHCVSMTVSPFTASHDWETVTNVVPGNSSSNRINLAAREKVLNGHQMRLNYSDILFIYFKL